MSQVPKPKKAKQAKPSAPLTTFEQIQELCAKPMRLELKYAGHPIVIECRRLKPSEMEILKLQWDELMPKLIPGKTEQEDRYDMTNPVYLKKKTETESSTRAQAVFWTTKQLQESERGRALVPKMYSHEARPLITAFVQDVWSTDILDHINAAITSSAVSLGEQVNFTSPGGTPESQS